MLDDTFVNDAQLFRALNCDFNTKLQKLPTICNTLNLEVIYAGCQRAARIQIQKPRQSFESVVLQMLKPAAPKPVIQRKKVSQHGEIITSMTSLAKIKETEQRKKFTKRQPTTTKTPSTTRRLAARRRQPKRKVTTPVPVPSDHSSDEEYDMRIEMKRQRKHHGMGPFIIPLPAAAIDIDQQSTADMPQMPLSKPDTILNPTDCSFNINDHIIFEYEQSFFPGIILDIHGADEVKISSMIKYGANWKWPARPDVLVYRLCDVLDIIQEPIELRRGGTFKVTELDEY